jgi:antitoxin component YwqK of YwqJK toxin-antitoxin module
MKKACYISFAIILMVGCGEEKKAAKQNTSAVIDPNATSVADGKGASQESELLFDKGPDLDDPKVLERILEEAVESLEVGFSGWRRIDHANGKLSSLSQYREGGPDGLQAGWHENGQKRIRIRMKDGRPQGLSIAWDENGSKIHEVRYKDSYRSFDATIFRWHENGQKAYEATYAKDRLVETSWHENGQQSSEKNYKNFERDGAFTEWDQTGEILSEVHWKNGRRWDGQWTFISGDGEYEKRCGIILKDGSGTRIYYRKNGTVFHRTTFEDGETVEWIFPPSTSPLDAKDFGGDVAKVLEAMSEEDRKNIAVWPQEIRADFLEAVKDSLYLKREPKNFRAAGAHEMAHSRQWHDMMRRRLEEHEVRHRWKLDAESRRINGQYERLQDSFSSFIGGEIYEGRSLRVARKAEEDAQKRHLERAIAETKDEMKASVDGRQAIRRAKESGDTKLSLHGRDVTDLTPLAELTELTELDIYETEATDISPLAKLTKLITLKIRRTVLKDITPLASLTNLRELELYGNRELTDITPLTGLNKLTKLGIYGNPIADLSPLKGLSNLEHLHLQSIKITELTPLAKLTNLTTLEIQNSRETLTDLTQLRGLTNLEHLLLASNQITDLAPLTALRELTNLSLTDNMISNVTPLTELTNLTELDLRNNPIQLDQQAILRKALPNCVIRFGPR